MGTQKPRIGWSLLAGALAIAALLSFTACAVPSATAESGDCFQTSASASAINADECRARAARNNSRDQAAIAYFNAGRGDEAGAQWARAEDDFTRAVNISVNPDLTYLARVGLARAYRKDSKYADAGRVLADISNMPERRQFTNAAARLESAKLHLDNGEDRTAALNDLDIFTQKDFPKEEDQRVIREGRQLLFDNAVKLGKDEYARPASQETTDRALALFTYATNAGVASQGAIDGNALAMANVMLGHVYLRKAGLPAGGGPGGFDCKDRPDFSPVALNNASDSFRSALALSPDLPLALDGRGCALQALGQLTPALADYKRAADLVPHGDRDFADIQIAYAEALEHVDPVAAQRRYRMALQAEADDPVGQAYVLVAIAKNERNAGDRTAALRDLTKAVDSDGDNIEAYLVRGEVYADLDRREEAAKDFQTVVDRTGQPGVDHLRGRAYFRLSQIETRDARRAANNADAALKLEDRPEYRKQACETRIEFGLVGDADGGDGRCNGNSGRYFEAYRDEGLYHLRRTFLPGIVGANQSREWEAALKAFTAGETRLDNAPNAVSALSVDQLRSDLTLGKGLSEFCVGLQDTGQAIINSANDLVNSERRFKEAAPSLKGIRGAGLSGCAPRK